MFLSRHAKVWIAVTAASLAMAVHGRGLAEGELAITCTNPHSRATWQIRIDYKRGTVDANPARITDAEIAWRDAKDGGNYTLDRASGKLTVILPSSTGGFFLHDQCALPR